jgi:hypothetical protein
MFDLLHYQYCIIKLREFHIVIEVSQICTFNRYIYKCK